MLHSADKNSGLTLIEILLAVGAFAVLGVGIASLTYLYVIFSEQLPQEQLRAKVLRSHQSSLESLRRNIRESGEILATTTINTHLYTTATTTLVLRRRAIDADGLIMARSRDIVVYTLSGASAPYSLRKLVEPGEGSAAHRADLILNNAVKELAFSYNHSTVSRATAVSVRLVTGKSINQHVRSATSTIKATLH